MRANKHLLLWSSLGTLALLMGAAYEENALQEWRVQQRRYRELLPAVQRADFGVRLRQVVVPALGVTDRCISCHLGMAPGETALPGDLLFAAHPDVAHDPAAYGCVTCHGGQGRATARADAHGEVPHWPEPMIPRRFAEAGCGACHTHLAVPNRTQLARGERLFERYDCRACHAADGRGGTLRPGGTEPTAPDLSHVGLTGYDEGWYASHLAAWETDGRPGDQPVDQSGGEPGSELWRESFGPIPDDQRVSLAVFLGSRVGAPRLVEAKALFHSLGCRGCHPVGGVGGDDGPDLTREGERDPGQLDFTHVPGGGRSLAAWLAQHFRAPATVVPGSQMPEMGLDEEQIGLLTLYMLSLRRTGSGEAFWPQDRIRAERFDERELATDGATLYQAFCAACHGPEGEGRRYPGMTAFPAIGNSDFLALASDDFLRQTVRRGRPGRRMPAWGEREGGLRPSEIDAVVAHLREIAGGVQPRPDPRPRRWVTGDPQRGEELYRASCAPCHGERGEGLEGTALANRVFLETVTDTYLVATIRDGRQETSMPAFGTPSVTRPLLTLEDIEAVVSHIRSWEEEI